MRQVTGHTVTMPRPNCRTLRSPLHSTKSANTNIHGHDYLTRPSMHVILRHAALRLTPDRPGVHLCPGFAEQLCMPGKSSGQP